MEITAALVKELRERTGSGLMECKRALVESGGDIEEAVAAMRKSGLVKADKKAGRTAADGTIVLRLEPDGRAGVLVEVNCETDFVAKGADFTGFAAQVAEQIASRRPADLAALLELPLGGERSVDTARRELVAKLGENVSVRRFAALQGEGGVVGGYLHGTRIGVLVELRGGDADLAKDIAMHVAASRPVAVAEQDVPAELLAKEREIFLAQAQESGKPREIVEKMVDGRLKKFLAEVTLVAQPFVKNPDVSVAQLLKGAGASVVRFVRFEVGEGIEKKDGNFAEEVMAQVRGS